MIDFGKIDFICKEKSIIDDKVIYALKLVDRTMFIDQSLHKFAFDDVTLPIGFGQTISAISTVGSMCEILNIQKDDKVLEVGSGCGYSCSVMSHLSNNIFSVERVKDLHLFAKEMLLKQKIYHVKLKYNDGSLGWGVDGMLFDKISVACACPDIPASLISQLSDNGMAVIPIGDDEFQELILVKKKKGDIFIESLGETKFVPMLEGVV